MSGASVRDRAARFVPAAMSCMLLLMAAAQAEEAPFTESDGWRLYTPDFSKAPARKSGELPLCDQDNKSGWKRLDGFWDEFGGNTLDQARWWPKNPTWAGRPPGRFEESNLTVSGGCLRLAARPLPAPEGEWDHATAALQSRERVLYGCFEVRARVMAACVCNAFWFYDATPELWTEIDVFEIGARAPEPVRGVHMTAHVFRMPGHSTHRQWSQMLRPPFDPAADFHVYTLEWTPGHLRWHVDGLLVREGKNTLWHQPLTLNCDVEIMRDWFGPPGKDELPAFFEIDYVRAWTGGPADGSGANTTPKTK